jgi:hypothetical protein
VAGRDTIKSLKAEIEELRKELRALQAVVARMPKHDPFKPIGPSPSDPWPFSEPRKIPPARPWDDIPRPILSEQ